MDDRLIDALRREEAVILGELHGNASFRRLEVLRRMLHEALPIGADLDAALGGAPQRPRSGAIGVIPLSGPRNVA